MLATCESVSVGAVTLNNNSQISLVAGPCQMESRDHAIETAEALAHIARERKIGFIYKSSFDKANRTTAYSPRGMGLERSLAVFDEIRTKIGVPVTTDVHEPHQCAEVARVTDMLQIPALLSKQTDLLQAAARTGLPVNVKKGQFLAPGDLVRVVQKLQGSGNKQVVVTERGTCFGYNYLVNDFKGIPRIKHETRCPVLFDATTSVQTSGSRGDSSGGEREYVPAIARAACAVGIAGIFVETHPHPEEAPSDGALMLPLSELPRFLDQWLAIDAVVKRFSTLDW